MRSYDGFRLICTHPLKWPDAKPRAKVQISGRFSENKRWLTPHEAQSRVIIALEQFTPAAQRRSGNWLIHPDSCRLSTDIPVKNDGEWRAQKQWPRRQVMDAGAALTFEWGGTPRSIAIDKYHCLEDNIAALAASLRCLRSLERYDAKVLEAAMVGFAALPAPVTRRHWRAVFGGTESKDLVAIRTVYRKLAKRYHPDSGSDASDARMSELNLAMADARAELGG